MFVEKSKHWDQNVYSICPITGKGTIHMFIQLQFFDLKKYQERDDSVDQTPGTYLLYNVQRKI